MKLVIMFIILLTSIPTSETETETLYPMTTIVTDINTFTYVSGTKEVYTDFTF